MNYVLRLLAAFLLFGSVAFCQTAQETTNLQHQTFETKLASGATLRLHLHDGDFRVVGTDSEKISIHVDGKNVEQAKNIKIRVRAALRTSRSQTCRKKNFRSRSKSPGL